MSKTVVSSTIMGNYEVGDSTFRSSQRDSLRRSSNETPRSSSRSFHERSSSSKRRVSYTGNFKDHLVVPLPASLRHLRVDGENMENAAESPQAVQRSSANARTLDKSVTSDPSLEVLSVDGSEQGRKDEEAFRKGQKYPKPLLRVRTEKSGLAGRRICSSSHFGNEGVKKNRRKSSMLGNISFKMKQRNGIFRNSKSKSSAEEKDADCDDFVPHASSPVHMMKGILNRRAFGASASTLSLEHMRSFELPQPGDINHVFKDDGGHLLDPQKEIRRRSLQRQHRGSVSSKQQLKHAQNIFLGKMRGQDTTFWAKLREGMDDIVKVNEDVVPPTARKGKELIIGNQKSDDSLLSDAVNRRVSISYFHGHIEQSASQSHSQSYSTDRSSKNFSLKKMGTKTFIPSWTRRSTFSQFFKPGPSRKLQRDESRLNLEFTTKLKIKAKRARRKAHSKQRVKWVIRPNNRKKIIWDLFVGILIVYSVLTIPVKVAFELVETTAWVVMELTVDLIFGLDMILSFQTAYISGGILIISRKSIAKKYLTTWFVPDFLSTFPFDHTVQWLSEGSAYDEDLRLFKLVRIVRFARLLKLFRLLRVFRMARKLESVDLAGLFSLNKSVVSLASRMLKILFVAHLLSCCWYSLNVCGEENYDLWKTCGEIDNTGSRYLASFYFIIATMMAVGYGDISATYIDEQLFAILVQISGALAFGLIISSVTELVDTIDPYHTQRNQRLTDIKEYMIERRLPAALQRRIRLHFQYFYSKTTVFQESALLENLPATLYQNLMMDKHQEQVRTLKFFKYCLEAGQKDFVVTALPLLKPMLASANESIVVQGDIAEEVYFIAKGQINSLRYETEKRAVLIGISREGATLCLANVTCYHELHCTLKAVTLCDLFWLDMEDLEMMMDMFPSLAGLVTDKVTEELHHIDQVLESITIIRHEHPTKEFIHMDSQVRNSNEVEIEPVKGVLGNGNVRTVRILRASNIQFFNRSGNKIMDKEFANQMQWEEAEETSQSLASKLVIDPQSTGKMQWDMLIGLMTLYSVISTPFRIGFDVDNFGLIMFDWVIDGFFCLDILVNFRTLSEAGLELYFIDPKIIARRYLASWFIVDLASTLPIDLIFEALYNLNEDSAIGSIALIRIARLARFLKLIRLIKLARRAKETLETDINYFIEKFIRLSFSLLYLGHLFGCFLSYIALEFGDEGSWLDNVLDSPSLKARYVASLYWAFTTMTTVGYGDIVAMNDEERIYASIIMILGATVFGFIVGNVSKLAHQLNAAKSIAPRKMGHLSDYLIEQKVEFNLSKSIKKHMQYVFSVESAFNETGILKRLPRQIRRDTVLYSHRDIISHIPIFKRHSKSFISNVIRRMNPQFCQAGRFIYTPEESSDGIYFLIKGIAEEVYYADESESECIVVYIIEKGGFFGHRKFLNLLGRDLGARAFTDCCMYVLSCNEMAIMNEKHLSISNRLQSSLKTAIQEQSKKEECMKSRVEKVNRARNLTDLLRSNNRKYGGTGGKSILGVLAQAKSTKITIEEETNSQNSNSNSNSHSQTSHRKLDTVEDCTDIFKRKSIDYSFPGPGVNQGATHNILGVDSDAPLPVVQSRHRRPRSDSVKNHLARLKLQSDPPDTGRETEDTSGVLFDSSYTPKRHVPENEIWAQPDLQTTVKNIVVNPLVDHPL